MDAPIRAGRWLVSGALGLAVLGVGGCATGADADVTHAGPAVVVKVANSGPAEAPATKAPGSKAAGAVPGRGTGDERTAPATKVESDGQSKKVPVAKPRSINDSPVSPKSPASAKTAPTANTP